MMGGDIMNTEIQLVPMRRFPEYCDADSLWEEQKIGAVVKTITPPKKLQSNEFMKIGKYPIVDQSQKLICGYSDDSSAVINADSNELVIFGDHTCIIKYIDFPFVQGADGIKIILSRQPTKVSTRYLYQILKAFPIKSREYKRHFSELKEKKISYPRLYGEQCKIADCLFKIDSYITSINEKIEQLKAHKKGLMQKLFPQNGQTLPECRFPEFESAGEWKEHSMEDIFEIKNGYTPSKSNPQFWEGGTIPWFRMEDIRKNGNILSDAIQHITPNAVKGKGLFPAYSIILATTATIGEHALIIVDSLANQQFTFLTKCESFDCKLDMLYFHYYMFIIDEWCKRNTNSGGLLSVNMSAFKQLMIPFPQLNEQKKIAKCLFSIDKIINHFSKKISFIERQKKGLQQQLFPVLK